MNCPNCGRPNRPNVNFCENCGANLAPPPPPPPSPRRAYAPVRPGCPAGAFTACLNWALGFALVGAVLAIVLVFLCVIDVPAAPYQTMLPNFAVDAWERLDTMQAENCSRTRPVDDGDRQAIPQPQAPDQKLENGDEPEEAVQTNNTPCYLLGKVKDITLPDGYLMDFNERADKKWEITNMGTCPWDEDFQLVFVGGDPIVTIGEAYINQDVQPGESVEVWVPVVTGTQTGTFRSNWKMRSTSGEIFGGGENADTPFWVQIVVEDDSAPAPLPSGGDVSVDWGMGKMIWVGITKCPGPDFIPEVSALLTSTIDRTLIGFDFVLSGTQTYPLPEKTISCEDPGGNDFHTVSLKAGEPVRLTARFRDCDITNYVTGTITLRLYSAPQNLSLGEFSLPFEHTCGK